MSDDQHELGPVRQARVRRAPRYQAFLGTGAALGVLIALAIGFTGPIDPGYGRAKLIGYLAIGFGGLGALLGGLVAIMIERLAARRRWPHVDADRRPGAWSSDRSSADSRARLSRNGH